MIVLVSAALGILLGIRAAKKRNGTGLDMLQHAAGYGIAFTILGVFLTFALGWLAG